MSRTPAHVLEVYLRKNGIYDEAVVEDGMSKEWRYVKFGSLPDGSILIEQFTHGVQKRQRIYMLTTPYDKSTKIMIDEQFGT